MGHARHGRGRPEPELLLANKYGHAVHVFDLRTRRHLQTLDLGAEHQMALELRPAHDPTKAYGFVNSVISTVDLKLLKPRSHPRWSSFRVSGPALVLWSLLMSTAHGAAVHGATTTRESAVGTDGVLDTVLALGLHTVTMLAVMGTVAIVVYRKVGLNILRKAWVNFDLLWAGVLVLSGIFLVI